MTATPRLAVSVVEDITDDQAGRGGTPLPGRELTGAGQLARPRGDAAEGRAPCRQLVRRRLGDRCCTTGIPPRHRPSDDTLRVPIRVRGGVAGAIRLSGRPVDPLETAVAEDLGLRVGAAVDLARVCRTRAVITQTLQAMLLPQVPPRDPGTRDRRRCTGRRAHRTRSAAISTTCSRPGRTSGSWSSATCAARAPRPRPSSALARITIRAAAIRRPLPDAGPAPAQRGHAGPASAGFRGDRLRPARPPSPGPWPRTVACGGHPAPRVLRATGVVEAFGARGSLIGVRAAVALKDHTTRLRSGDALILYTNGLTQGRRARGVGPPSNSTPSSPARSAKPQRGSSSTSPRPSRDPCATTSRCSPSALSLPKDSNRLPPGRAGSTPVDHFAECRRADQGNGWTYAQRCVIFIRQGRDRPPGETAEARIAKALAHPLRARILQRLGDASPSPGDLADELEAPLGVVSYHVRMLRDYRVRRARAHGPRRGALQHFYRATARPRLDHDQWRNLPAGLRRELAAEHDPGDRRRPRRRRRRRDARRPRNDR